MRISDWSSDVCSSDLELAKVRIENRAKTDVLADRGDRLQRARTVRHHGEQLGDVGELAGFDDVVPHADLVGGHVRTVAAGRSEERRVGKECVVRVELGGRRIIKKKRENTHTWY